MFLKLIKCFLGSAFWVVAPMGCVQRPVSLQGGDVLAFTFPQPQGSDVPAKTLSLTFDDGPGPRTEELATYLASKGIQATFFMNGVRAKDNLPLLQKIKDQGHLIANHTYDHKALSKTTPSGPLAANIDVTPDPVAAVAQAYRILAPFVDQGNHLFRAPYGAFDSKVAAKLNASSVKGVVGSIHWNPAIDGGDWECPSLGLSAQACAERYLSRIDRCSATGCDRGVVLAHDSVEASVTVDMMISFYVPQLLAKGYKFIRLDQVPSIKAMLDNEKKVRVPAPIECPTNYTWTPLGTQKGGICTSTTRNDAWGPFTAAMQEACLKAGGGAPCNTNRWEKNFAIWLRKDGLCPVGAYFDIETRYCVEGENAFGPFPKALVDACIRWGGGDTVCPTARWNLAFLRGLLGIP